MENSQEGSSMDVVTNRSCRGLSLLPLLPWGERRDVFMSSADSESACSPSSQVLGVSNNDLLSARRVLPDFGVPRMLSLPCSCSLPFPRSEGVDCPVSLRSHRPKLPELLLLRAARLKNHIPHRRAASSSPSASSRGSHMLVG